MVSVIAKLLTRPGDVQNTVAVSVFDTLDVAAPSHALDGARSELRVINRRVLLQCLDFSTLAK